MKRKSPLLFVLMWPILTSASDPLNIIDYAPVGTKVDRTGVADVSQALASAIAAANAKTATGEPACVYIPPGVYRIVTPPPPFVRAGCVRGDGPSQSVIDVDPKFEGDLFSWSESWVVTTPGPMAVGLKVRGSKDAANLQNAFVFYDRNDQVFMDNIDVVDLHGRALYSGVSKGSPRAYMRESHLRSLRFFNDGTPSVPVVEFNSQGVGQTDATNEIRISQMDVYGSRGPSFIIRNNGTGGVRNITIDALRIEGSEDGTTAGDLLTIGDPMMTGNVNNITITSLELIDPCKGYAALRLTAPKGAMVPYQITIQGLIGGGAPAGQGLRIDAARGATFHLSAMHTLGTNVTIASGVAGIMLDGNGDESNWTYSIDPTAARSVHVPVLRSGNPAAADTHN
jgi:Pectate lyase superfamily protein